MEEGAVGAESFFVVMVTALIILGGVSLMIVAMVNRRKIREMQYRERLAMIERGLVPSPESDPMGFEAATGLTGRDGWVEAARYRTAGVLMIGLGLGLTVLISFLSRQPRLGIGVGGGWAILGAASLLNYFLMISREGPPGPMPRSTPTPSSRAEPPGNAGP
jgi:hypothetical protein